MRRYRKKGIWLLALCELIGLALVFIYYFIIRDALFLCMGIPSITAVVVLLSYVEFLGRKDFILTSDRIQLPSKPTIKIMTGPLDRSQIMIKDITGCRVYNNLILVWIGIIGYPIRKEQLDDFDHVKDALIKLLKSRKVPIETFHRDIVEPPTV